jgi:enoyl-CoA hydratase
MWMALTGSSVGASDMLYCGAATHYMTEAQTEGFMETIRAKGFSEKILRHFCEEKPESGVMKPNKGIIERCFSKNSVENVLAALGKEPAEWAQAQARIIESRSPTSLKLAHEHLRRAETLGFDEVLAQDLQLVRHVMRGHDYYEGVRAAVVDKDKNPQWRPATLADVTRDMVDNYFDSSRHV